MIKSILPKVKYREKNAVVGEYSFSKICLLLANKMISKYFKNKFAISYSEFVESNS